jgi:hypothetical protein
MKSHVLKGKELIKLASLEYDMKQMLQKKFKIRKDDLNQEEWRDLISRCYSVIEDSGDDACNSLIIRAYQKCADPV